MPELQLLSNGSYHLIVTSAGLGYSKWKDLSVTRWHADSTLDNGGTRCFVRDHVNSVFWTTTASSGPPGKLIRAKALSNGRVTFQRNDHGIDIRSEIAVSGDDPVELRRTTFINKSDVSRTLSATSYAEIVLATLATDSAHPAFSKLFVETEIDCNLQTIYATRRPSRKDDPTPWVFHAAISTQSSGEAVSYETDRMRFIGRGRDATDPQAMGSNAALSGTAGPVLDAVAAIRVPFVLEPGASVTIDWLTGVASTREACVDLTHKYRDSAATEQILQQAGSYRKRVIKRLGASNAGALIYQRMASSLVYDTPALRADAKIIEANRYGQSNLWRFGISGDLPIVLLLLHAGNSDSLGIVKQIIQAHGWWNAFGLQSDLAILCAPSSGEGSPPLDEIRDHIGTDPSAGELNKPGGIFVLDDTTLDDAERILLKSVARIVLTDTEDLASQMERRLDPANQKTDRVLKTNQATDALTRPPPEDLTAFNGYGGFSVDGREYVITHSASRMTPAPWVNVIANPDFGTLVSESGSATTWSMNAHEFRLTPWPNDPVTDPNTEAIYIRDDKGHVWSPTLLPTRGSGTYRVRHGFGYSVFEHSEHNIDSELLIFVAMDMPIKFSVLRLRNTENHSCTLSVTGYVEWVLGDERVKTRMHVITKRDTETGALLAGNRYNTDFGERTAFFDVDDGTSDFCGDRADFFGRHGSRAAPAALAQAELSRRVGAALDPCAALRVRIELEPGQEHIVIFRLGAAASPHDAQDLVLRGRERAAADTALETVHQYWRRTLGTVQVRTADPTLDVLANGWLLYQLISSRLWGRTAFYQSSGAFGFRDQLQDVMALVHAAPDLVREHLLRSAARQFVEGDVQHWWHPPSGKGVRTRCSDDFLWLALVTSRYVETTGDRSVLDEPCHYLSSPALKDDETSRYEVPAVSDDTSSLYEHCVRAIRHGLRYGQHGLPLMGSGDWNDGMDQVGVDGKGESVWMAFFLITVLKKFAPLADKHGDEAFARRCEREATQLSERTEAAAWDGKWYLRAWFDDGTVLGSAANSECQIDSIAQSWSVLSGSAPAERARGAMASLDQHLVRRDARVIQLLDPPFDKSVPSPGYIQGYVPGVRENGGQYTHAAVWAAMAFASLGDATRAWDLFAILNPVRHADNVTSVATYKVEPYVVAGDVYAFEPHAGRGGWSWYTGSAGWMYRLILESLSGFERRGNTLRINPLLRPDEANFDIDYRFGSTTYFIACREAASPDAARVVLDGAHVEHNMIRLIDDGNAHSVLVTVSRAQRPRYQEEGEQACK